MADVSPLDFFKPDTEYATDDVVADRLSVCASCPSFMASVKVCRKCGCHMPWKTKLTDAACPLSKW